MRVSAQVLLFTSPTQNELSFLYALQFFFLIWERELVKERGEGGESWICCSTYWCIHWLIWDQTHNLRVLGQCCNQLSYPTRASVLFLTQDPLWEHFKSGLLTTGLHCTDGLKTMYQMQSALYFERVETSDIVRKHLCALHPPSPNNNNKFTWISMFSSFSLSLEKTISLCLSNYFLSSLKVTSKRYTSSERQCRAQS